MKKTSRRNFMTKGAAAGAVAAAAATPVAAQGGAQKKVHWRDGKKPDRAPLFSGAVSYGNLLFISGKGYHQEGDIKVHTDNVLKTIQEELERCGSSMMKVINRKAA